MKTPHEPVSRPKLMVGVIRAMGLVRRYVGVKSLDCERCMRHGRQAVNNGVQVRILIGNEIGHIVDMLKRKRLMQEG
jgi:hypothetical protein